MTKRSVMPFAPVWAAIAMTLMLTGCAEPQSGSSQSAQPTATAETAYPAFDKPGVSVQLWSVKDDVKADFVGTLQALADMGFDGVEFAGDFGPYQNNPTGLKAKLAELGLAVSGAHVGFDALRGDKLVATALFHQQLGTPYVIVPWDERAFAADTVDLVAKELTVIAERLAPYGLRVGYHNHAQEMADYGDITFWQYIASNTPESVVLQQDVGWTLVAEKDPVAMVKAYPGRTLTTHFKAPEYETPKGTPIVGQDGINWLPIYQATAAVGGAKWVVLEQEQYPNGLTPLEAVAATKQGFDSIITAGN